MFDLSLRQQVINLFLNYTKWLNAIHFNGIKVIVSNSMHRSLFFLGESLKSAGRSNTLQTPMWSNSDISESRYLIICLGSNRCSSLWWRAEGRSLLSWLGFGISHFSRYREVTNCMHKTTSRYQILYFCFLDTSLRRTTFQLLI